MTESTINVSSTNSSSPVITSCDEDALRYLSSQLFRKELVKPPPTFTREDDIQIHMKKIDEYVRVTDVKSDSDKVYVLVESLQDDLLKELKMMKDFQAMKDDFKLVRDIVINLFKRKVRVALITPFLCRTVVENSSNETPKY